MFAAVGLIALRQYLPLNEELAILPRLTRQWAPGSRLSPFPNAVRINNMQSSLSFYMGARDLNSISHVFVASTIALQTSVTPEVESS